jgi:medium-chain acyl-[acyl-carrier-protein] hydrolase
MISSKMNKLRLFCLPYAGGSAALYFKWKKYLPNFIELCPIELAGRGGRFKEACYETLLDAVDDVCNQVKKYLDERPYALFGHSMGSLIVYELYYKLKEDHQQLPCHIFFSGGAPPHIRKDKPMVHTLPDGQFKEAIMKLGGMSEELFEDEELAKIFIPLLRADYRILETYQYIERTERIECDLTLLGGKEDPEVLIEDLSQWGRYTKGKSELYEFEGGHFFVHKILSKIVKIVIDKLMDNEGL